MARIIRVDGTEEDLTDVSLESLQKAVGGYIECVSTNNGKVLVINEEGKLMNLALNLKASQMYEHSLHDQIFGDVVVCEDWELE